MGIDSLLGVELVEVLSQTINEKLDSTLIWNFPTPNSLAHHLENNTGISNVAEKHTKDSLLFIEEHGNHITKEHLSVMNIFEVSRLVENEIKLIEELKR